MFPALIKSHIHPTYTSVAEEDTKPLPLTSMAFSSLDVTTQPERVFVQTGDKSLPSAQLESHSVLSLLGACSPSLQLPDFTQDDTSPIWFLHSLPPGNRATWYDMSIEDTSTTMQVAFPMSHDLHTPAFSELELLPLHVPSSASSHSYGRDLDGFGKVSSKMKTIFSLRKMAAPAEHPSSYRGDSTLPTFTIKSEFVLPSKDITHLASGSWVSLSPQQETSALEPEGILCHESTIQHSHLGFDNFRLLSESLSLSIFHLGNEDLTKVLMLASKEATCSTLLSSIDLNAYGDPSIALRSEASFLLTDEFGIRSANKLNTGCFFTLIKRTPCTSLDVIRSEDFSSSIVDLALQSTNSLEAHNTVVINNHVLADVSNALMETMKMSSSFVDMHFVTQSPVVIKSDAMLSEYFALSEVHTSWFLDVSNLVKSSVHLLTPELFSTSVSGSVALSPTRPMTGSLSGLYGDGFIPETLPKLYPESLWHSKLTSQQSELDSHALGIQISDALVPVTVSSGMSSYFSTNIFLSVIGILALGSSAFVTRSAVDMILPFPLSQPSDVKMTMSTDTGSVSRDPKLTEVFTKPTIALGSNHDTGGSEFQFSRTLRENLPSTKFRTAVATRENILDAVVMISSPGLFLPVESSVPITVVPTISEPNLLPISHLDAKTYIVRSKSKQTPKETLLISTWLPPSSQILEQSIASLTDFSSIAINALLPLEGSSWANLPALSVLSKVTCPEFDMILSEDPSFVPTATLQSSSTPPFISIIEPSLPVTTFVLRLNTILSSTHSVPPSAMWEMLKPTLEVTSHPTDVAPQNPTFPVSSPRPISSSERNRIMIALIKEENLLEVMLQVNRSIPIFEDSFWQMVSKALKETYLQALPSTGESNKTRRRGDSSENIQVSIF
ncbi:hypothetical protein scyTo_0017716 [Scyliorhinus torazame]|uniref:Uncharacterized protein n=1 Tax=Scyliorhinus torazame TaxID=75743 RepID=A0A401PYI0_SCYTO|nr:hypothetical protein [Scyliorhinus torazame]